MKFIMTNEKPPGDYSLRLYIVWGRTTCAQLHNRHILTLRTAIASHSRNLKVFIWSSPREMFITSLYSCGLTRHQFRRTTQLSVKLASLYGA